MKHKTPSVRLSATSWVHRCLLAPHKTGFGIKQVQICSFASQLISSMEDGDPAIRCVSAGVLAALFAICGPKSVGEHIEQLDAARKKKIQSLAPQYAHLVKSSRSKKSSCEFLPSHLGIPAQRRKSATGRKSFRSSKTDPPPSRPLRPNVSQSAASHKNSITFAMKTKAQAQQREQSREKAVGWSDQDFAMDKGTDEVVVHSCWWGGPFGCRPTLDCIVPL